MESLTCAICLQSTEGDHLVVHHRFHDDGQWLDVVFCRVCIAEAADMLSTDTTIVPTPQVLQTVWNRYLDIANERECLAADLLTTEPTKNDVIT